MIDEPDEADELGGEGAELPLASAEPTVDASSIQTVRGRNRALLKANAEVILFWRSCLASAIGRRVLWDLLNNQCHIFEDRFACGPNGFPQPQATWFHAGENAIGMRLYRTLLRNDIHGVTLMHRENDAAFTEPKPRRKAPSES